MPGPTIREQVLEARVTDQQQRAEQAEARVAELESEMRRVRRMAQSMTAQPLARLKSIGRVATAVLDNDSSVNQKEK